MLLQTTVDSQPFDYLPEEVPSDLDLNLLNFPRALLLVREEYLTALNIFKSWRKPPVRGVVVTGHPGIGTRHTALKATLPT
jgi:hypothetical protein